MRKIAIFASGSGSNAQNIAEYFKGNSSIFVDCILTNNPKAYVIERANQLNIDILIFDRKEFYESEEVLKYLQTRNISDIVLAGFLWLIPSYLIKAYPGRIINIHPALLPKFGGKGMYGMRVHEAVIDAKEPESGITIHYVNEKYDEGNIVFQAKCTVSPTDTAENVAEKVHALEYQHFPKVIEKLLS
jgi:phosphoribosylglycinamide formyltransferase 1